MAEYDHLPVYKATYDLLQHIYRDKSIGSVPRDIKFTLVETLKKDILEILVLIYKAHYMADERKGEVLGQARELLPGIKARFRILFDLHHINPELFQTLAVEVESVSKQLAAWHAKTLKRLNEGVSAAGRAVGSRGAKELPGEPGPTGWRPDEEEA